MDIIVFQVGTGITNALINARKAVDKSFAGEAEDIPILSTSVAYGVYMAVSSNLRYDVPCVVTAIIINIIIIIKVYSQPCWGWLHEFCFSIPVYPKLNPRISCMSSDPFLLTPITSSTV